MAAKTHLKTALTIFAILFLIAHLIFRRDKLDSKLGIIMIIGYIVFLAPMYLMVLIEPTWAKVIPSVMCKYALLLAVTLGIFSFIKPKQKQIIEKEEIEN